MTWKPDNASIDLERKMEEANAPESDRDEVRRFAEWLRRRKDVKDGKEVPPRTPEMTAWLKGEDVEPPLEEDRR